MPCRTEAPDGNLGTILTKLFDIHVPAAANAIALPGVAAPHLKISMPFQCSPLLGSEPFVEECLCSVLGFAERYGDAVPAAAAKFRSTKCNAQ